MLVFIDLPFVFPKGRQGRSNEGTQFWFGFMEHLDAGNDTGAMMDFFSVKPRTTHSTNRFYLLTRFCKKNKYAAFNILVLNKSPFFIMYKRRRHSVKDICTTAT